MVTFMLQYSEERLFGSVVLVLTVDGLCYKAFSWVFSVYRSVALMCWTPTCKLREVSFWIHTLARDRWIEHWSYSDVNSKICL